MVAAETLTTYPGNPRRGDQDAITASIRDLGLYRTIIAQRSSGHVLAGNHTLRALLDLGATQVPVTWVDVDDTRAAAIVARDNRTSELGTYDDAELLALLTTDEDVLALSGYDDAAVDALRRAEAAAARAARKADPDDVPDVAKGPPVSQVGDVWQLGRHRLVVGDARDESVYDRMLDRTVPVAAMFTDPPYGVSIAEPDLAQARARNRRLDAKGVANDDLTGATLAEFLTAALTPAYAVTAPGGVWYVCSPPGESMGTFGDALRGLAGAWRHTLVWIKDQFVMGRADYHYRHEVIFYGWKPGAAHYFIGDRTQDTVWEIPRPRRSPEHPTMKPVALVRKALTNSTHPGAVVLDPFAGSGTTLIACEETDRTARLIELDPAYADVICRRYQRHTGIVPVRDGAPVDFEAAS